MSKIERLNDICRDIEELKDIDLDGNEKGKTKIEIVYNDQKGLDDIKKFIEYVMNDFDGKNRILNDVIKDIDIQMSEHYSIERIVITVRNKFLG